MNIERILRDKRVKLLPFCTTQTDKGFHFPSHSSI